MQNPATVGTASVGTVSAPPVAARRWRTEDWIAVILGFVVITAVLMAFHWKAVDLRNVVSAFRWTSDSQIAALSPGWIDTLDSITKEAAAKGQQNVADLGNGLRTALERKDRKA